MPWKIVETIQHMAVSIPMTVLGGLQLAMPKMGNKKAQAFQYR